MWQVIMAAAVVVQLGCADSRGQDATTDTTLTIQADALAQPTDTTIATTATPAPNPPVQSDAEILGAINARDANLIEAATMAKDKAASADVRSFATDILASHQRSLTRGNELAKALNLSRELPPDSAMARKQSATMDQLSLSAGAAFDRVFVEYLRESLAAELAKFNERYLPSAQHADIRAFVTERMEPTRAEQARAAAWLANQTP